MSAEDIITAIRYYFTSRRKTWPRDADTAVQWAITELGEINELLLDRKGPWSRNNPEKHGKYSPEGLSEELGDAIMMLLVAGIVEGVNPLDSMMRKMRR